METNSQATDGSQRSRGSGIIITLLIVAAAINFIDFVFYGQNLYNLTGAAGFAIAAYGTYRRMRLAEAIGGIAAMGSILVKHFW